MGALLLIVVVIVAVASLAAFVAEAQKTAQTRQSYLTSVADENLQIEYAQFAPASTGPTGCTSTCWGSVTLAVRNMNTQPSDLSQIKIGPLGESGGSWVTNWQDAADNNYGQGAIGYMVIPARATVSVVIDFSADFTGQNIPVLPISGSTSITLMTELGNFFTTTYNPPTAVAQVSVTSISYQDFNRDVVSLDGSQSAAFNQSTIVSYDWNVLVPYASTVMSNGVQVNPDGCTSGAFSEPTQTDSALPPVYAASVGGKTTQFLQESNLPAPLANYCLTGPFEISLTVTDSLGFIGTSSPIGVAIDPDMAPISTFSATLVDTSSGPSTNPCMVSSTSCGVTGNVATIFGTAPPPNTYITVLYSGVSTPVPIDNGVYTSGSFSCVSGATVQVSLGSLPSQILQCPVAQTGATTTITSTITTTSTSTSTTTVVTTTSLTAPSVFITAEPDPIDNDQTSLLTGYASNGVPPYTYAWYPDANCGDPLYVLGTSSSYTTPHLMSTTTYCVEVTDSIGLTTTGTATVTVEPVLTVTISPSNPTLDDGQTITAAPSGGSGGYTYQWYSGSTCSGGVVWTSASYAPASSATYCVEVTDSLDSTATATDIVTVNPTLVAPVISVSPTTVSSGGSATLSTTTSFSGGTSPYTCQWLEDSGSGYTDLGSSFSCTVGDLPTISTGALTATTTFELQVTDSSSLPVTVTSNVVTVTVS